jgi:hypothetical protein
LTVADVRRLSDTAFCSLMNGPLALPIAGVRPLTAVADPSLN